MASEVVIGACSRRGPCPSTRTALRRRHRSPARCTALPTRCRIAGGLDGGLLDRRRDHVSSTGASATGSSTARGGGSTICTLVDSSTTVTSPRRRSWSRHPSARCRSPTRRTSVESSLPEPSTWMSVEPSVVVDSSVSVPNESSTTVTSVSLPMLTSSPASIVVDWSLVCSTSTAPPAAIASSPDATTASLSKVCVTSPSAQMFWFTDWSTIVSRSSTQAKLLRYLLDLADDRVRSDAAPCCADACRTIHRDLDDVRPFDDHRRDRLHIARR